ncbi:MAG: hypothetical protein HOK81_10465, partial [Rhodospirillaceae bacterium]|nr:hypothetical protein [Rhodospirillaceae bacterium]
MIGLFGAYHRQAKQPADIEAMTRAIPERYRASILGGPGAALGRASHRLDFGSSEAKRGTRRAVAMGTVHNADEVAARAGL